VHPHGLDGPDIPATIEAMAADLLSAIRRVRPKGPYLLGGHCNGALVAVEMARQLTAEGEDVPLVVVLDAKAPGRPTQVIPDVTTAGPPSAPHGSARDIFLRYRRAMARYAPARYPGRIAVLCSERTRDVRPHLGWSSVSERVETHAIPGSHHTSITRHVATTGARIRACLEAACEMGLN
jgi:thioesterase domain-containing protein